MRSWIRRVPAAAAMCALLAACGAGGQAHESRSEPTSGPVSPRPVRSFDLYAQASAEGNPLFADVYGITLNPLRLDRLTAGKRISTMEANADHVVVAAADSDVGDRLGYVGDGGAIVDIPGLGRPNAFAPAFDHDGTLLFEQDAKGPSGASVNQFFRYAERSGQKTLLRDGDENSSGPFPLFDGRLAYSTGKPENRLLIKQGDRTVLTFTVPDGVTELVAGSHLIALAVDAPGSHFGDKPSNTSLIDLTTGKQRVVPGWEPLCWNPAGTKLLVRRTANPTDSELALLDPDHPEAVPQPLGTVPHLVIYHAAWVARP